MTTSPDSMHTSYALLTPSFAPDFERCELLVESCDRYLAPGVQHYIIVDRRDEQLFRRLRSGRTHVIVKQEVLPRWLHQVPMRPKWWWRTNGLPVRGWMIQQIVKLSADRFSPEDAYVFADSDTFFLRPFDPADWAIGDRLPLFREVKPEIEGPMTTAWYELGAPLLGIDLAPPYRTNYVTSLAVWTRRNLVGLHRHLEDFHGMAWQQPLCGLRTVSEYTLYGMYCEHVLAESSGQYYTDAIATLNYWHTDPLNEQQVRRWGEDLEPQQVMGMISAKSFTPVPVIRSAMGLRTGAAQ